MRTHKEVSAEFDLDEYGTIRSPGRFEGEPWWIVNVSDWDMDGDGEILSSMEDGMGEYGSIFEDLTKDETLAFGLDSSTVAILYTVSEQGFCSVEELSAPDLDRVRERAEENAGPCEGDYIISDTRDGVSVSIHEGKHLFTFGSLYQGAEEYAEGSARRYILDRMGREGFYPNVWRLSDHGNLLLLDLSTEVAS